MNFNMQQIQEKLNSLQNWFLEENKIRKIYEFNTCLESIAFANKVARIAEEQNHHPDILIQFKKVTLSLFTHDEGGITEKDFMLAKRIDGG